VLVVAGFGHVITLSLEVIIKRMRAKQEERRKQRNGSSISEKAPVSSAYVTQNPVLSLFVAFQADIWHAQYKHLGRKRAGIFF
jgi:hypothetical protein